MVGAVHRIPTSIHWWGGAFVAYAGASLQWSSAGFYSQAYLATLVVAYICGTFLHDPRWLWSIVAVALAFNVAIAGVSQAFGSVWEIPFGLYGNPNFLGAALALGLAGAVAYAIWWFIPIALLGLFLSQSRGALAAAGAVGVAALWRWNRLAALSAIFATALIVASLSTERTGSIADRLGVWQDTVNHLSVFGAGWGGFFADYWTWEVRTNFIGTRAPHAYNDVLELLYELGVGTIPLWIALVLAFESEDHRPKLILLAFGVLSLTYFPLHVPTVGHLFALTLGSIAPFERKAYGPLAA